MSSRRPPSPILLAVVVLAAVLQLAVPHGWMVGSAASGVATLVPCPATSPALANYARTRGVPAEASGHEGSALHAQHRMDAEAAASWAHGHMASASRADDSRAAADHDDHDGHDGHSGGASTVCDFAALGAPATLPEQPQIDAPAFTPAASLLPGPTRLYPARGLAAPPPPSTGPPVLT